MKSLVTLVLLAAQAAAGVVMWELPLVVVCGEFARRHADGSTAGPPISLFAIDANDTRHHEFQSVALFLQDAAVRWRTDGMHELEGQRVQPAGRVAGAWRARGRCRNSDFAVRRPTSA